MNNILILGAGLMQKKAILEAKKIANAIVIDANKNAECVPLADIFFQIDLKDKEEILKLAQKLNSAPDKLLGIFTAGTDFSSSVSFAAESLKLNSHSYNSTLNATNKSLMRKCFNENNIPSPDFKSFIKSEFSKEEVKKIAEKIGFPLVVKPCDNMGGRGCRLARNFDEIFQALEEAFNFSKTNSAIVEEFMDGPEFSIDALIYENSFTVTGFADRNIFYPPYFIEMGHTIPSKISEEQKLQLISTFASGVKALGLTCGACKADIKFTKNGPMIGEIAARLSGGYMSGWTFPYCSDFNLTEQALLISCGMKPEKLIQQRIKIPYKFYKNSDNNLKPFDLYEIQNKNFCAERAWISIPGIVKELPDLNNLKTESIKEIFPRNIKVGDEVNFPRNNVSKCGNVISVSDSYLNASEIAEKTVSKILIKLEPNNTKTENFLLSKEENSEEKFPPDSYSFYKEIKNLKISGTIPENQPAENFIPQELNNFINSHEKNWNYLTFKESLQIFDEKFKIHPEIPSERFFKALCRGGLQAIIYVLDSISENINEKN